MYRHGHGSRLQHTSMFIHLKLHTCLQWCVTISIAKRSQYFLRHGKHSHSLNWKKKTLWKYFIFLGIWHASITSFALRSPTACYLTGDTWITRCSWRIRFGWKCGWQAYRCPSWAFSWRHGFYLKFVALPNCTMRLQMVLDGGITSCISHCLYFGPISGITGPIDYPIIREFTSTFCTTTSDIMILSYRRHSPAMLFIRSKGLH